jgi:hypothetical protein
MKLTTGLAAVLLVALALPAAAQQLHPGYTGSLPRVCTVTQQPPVAPKVITIGRNGTVTTTIDNTSGATTTTTVCSSP